MKPEIVVLVDRDMFLSHWTMSHAFVELQGSIGASFPDETVYISQWSKQSAAVITVAPQHEVSEQGLPLNDYESVPQDLLESIGALAASVLIGYERLSLAGFRKRLSNCNAGLVEYRSRPAVLSEFMAERQPCTEWS